MVGEAGLMLDLQQVHSIAQVSVTVSVTGSETVPVTVCFFDRATRKVDDFVIHSTPVYRLFTSA